MADSGVRPSDACYKIYRDDFKLKRKHAYLILEIKDGHVEVKAKGPEHATPQQFSAALGKEKDFCYGVYSGANKIGLLIYGPSGANIKHAMLYASSVTGMWFYWIAIWQLVCPGEQGT